jgi:hypothetical protein
MTTLVRYQVPVFVEVDERRGTVLSVNVDDEAIMGPVDVLDPGGSTLDQWRRDVAVGVAEREGWPTWELGH